MKEVLDENGDGHRDNPTVRPTARDLCVLLKAPLSEASGRKGLRDGHLLPTQLDPWHVRISARKPAPPPPLGLALPGRSEGFAQTLQLGRKVSGAVLVGPAAHHMRGDLNLYGQPTPRELPSSSWYLNDHVEYLGS